MGLDMFLYRETEQVAYWRKFNALHGWFVDNVQGGRDDGGRHLVTQYDLKNLLDVLKQVDQDHSKATIIFKTRSGSYFGNLEYNDYFFEQIRQAIKTFEDILEKDKGKNSNFYYYADW